MRFGLFVGAACVALLGLSPLPSLAASRPNVLFILTDDQRPWGALGTEPTVKAGIRDEGVTFGRAFATTPLCCPSRASLLSGLYMLNLVVETNREKFDILQQVDSMTIADSLQADGYTTGMFGKYLNGWPNDVSPSGFDRFATTPRMTYDPAEWDVNGAIQDVTAYPTTFIRRQSTSFLNWAADQGKPFFLYVTPMAPHIPATPQPKYADLPVGSFHVTAAIREKDRTDKPPYVQTQDPWPLNSWKAIRAAQLRSLASVDDLVRVLLNRLVALHELDNTIIIYSSDNGFMWGEHGLHVGGKSVPYLPSVRVPLFISWPGHVDPATSDGRLVALLDLAPTILDATGTPLPHQMDGIDLFQGGIDRRSLLLEFSTWSGFRVPTWAALVTHTYEYVEYDDDLGSVTFREYYDIAADPSQLVNLLRDGHPSNNPDVAALSNELASLRTCSGSNCIAT
jgi:arylsulfatase A-like enzyme